MCSRNRDLVWFEEARLGRTVLRLTQIVMKLYIVQSENCESIITLTLTPIK